MKKFRILMLTEQTNVQEWHVIADNAKEAQKEWKELDSEPIAEDVWFSDVREVRVEEITENE